MTFKELNLIQPLLGALDKIGYTQPTPIQEQSIPHLLEGRDIFGCAQTGTGKTAAFALPILQLLDAQKIGPRSGIKALILAPTRELAIQIHENVVAYSENLNITSAVIFGGVNQHSQVQALRSGVNILIATPGRLLDLMQQGFIKLNMVTHFVLDEADRMLDMGFIHDIKKIIPKLPTQKQTIFFSATVAPDIKKLADSLLHKPVTVEVTPISTAAELVDQSVYFVDKNHKRTLLKHLIKENNIQQALVFTRTKHGADKVVKELNKSGISAEAIHGNKSQNARERALSGFKNHAIRILVATDIASRGIDVDKLGHVINFELPEVAETYVHRIGRTGRAGSEGVAFSFCDADEMQYFKGITKLMKRDIRKVEHPFNN
ncbi:MAG: DEAD/DEAH box helicase [Chitinophagaceae bacterium]|jgi:ATP-dependent RNA helicase RhlE